MYRRLLDPFQSVALPETVEDLLDDHVAKCTAYNRWGTLLAAGCEDGRVVIYDMETRGVARSFQPHSQTVSCLAWSRDGHFLASAGLDGTLSLWRVLDNQQEASTSLEGPALALSLDRRDPHQVIASLAQGPPVVLDLRSGTVTALPVVPTDADARKGSKGAVGNGGGNASAHALALFSQDGRHIYLGHARGVLAVLDRASGHFLDVLRVGASAHVTSLQLGRGERRADGSRPDLLLANCADRCARLLEVGVPGQDAAGFPASEAPQRMRTAKAGKGGAEPDQEPPGPQPALLRPLRSFQNTQVDAQPWVAVAFSHDMEHVAAATQQHAIYLYGLHSGALDKVLTINGGRDALAGMAWHPGASALATLGHSGKVYCWARIYRQAWSAFAPDFTELDENEEYIEREDEFDINPREDAAAAANGDARAAAANGDMDEDAEVDIGGEDPHAAAGDPFADCVSSDEDVAGGGAEASGKLRLLHHLPIEVQRRASPAPAVDEKLQLQPEGPADMEDDVSLSGSDDEVAGNGYASAAQEDGVAGLTSREMVYQHPGARQGSEEEQPGSSGRRKRKPARSLDYEGDLRMRQPEGLAQPSGSKMMRPSHMMPDGLDTLQIPDGLFGL